MNANRNISIIRDTPGLAADTSTLTITGGQLEIVGVLPHATLIDPRGPDDAAKLLFYADQHLKLAEGLADALRALLAEQPDGPDYDKQRALERYENLRHKLTPED